jgi:hypothetical protein
MNCPQCGRSNPEDARFCIYCAAQLVPLEPAASAQPVTGPTTRLEEPKYMQPTLNPAPPFASSSSVGTSGQGTNRGKEMNTALWLIGLGALFLTGTFWPGILVLLGFSSYLQGVARGRQQKALRGLIFFTGLAVLFWTNLFWPGILILIGATLLLSSELRRSTP